MHMFCTAINMGKKPPSELLPDDDDDSDQTDMNDLGNIEVRTQKLILLLATFL